MRNTILKKNSTRPERILAEELKNHHIPFRHRVLIKGKECDFLIGNLVIEVGNHKGNPYKNAELLNAGYSLYTFSNQEVISNRLQVINSILKWHHQEKEQLM
jgi:very-short-patch-repair endonuclease